MSADDVPHPHRLYVRCHPDSRRTGPRNAVEQSNVRPRLTGSKSTVAMIQLQSNESQRSSGLNIDGRFFAVCPGRDAARHLCVHSGVRQRLSRSAHPAVVPHRFLNVNERRCRSTGLLTPNAPLRTRALTPASGQIAAIPRIGSLANVITIYSTPCRPLSPHFWYNNRSVGLTTRS